MNELEICRKCGNVLTRDGDMIVCLNCGENYEGEEENG